MTNTLKLEATNFKIYSWNWKKDKDWVKTNPKCDVWEKDWEQYFTWDAMMRETEKAGKKVPTREQWKEIVSSITEVNEYCCFNESVHEKLWLPLSGNRSYSGGSFYGQGHYSCYWSSSPDSTGAYYALFNSGGGTIANYSNRSNGFSVRCLLELGDESNDVNEVSEIETSDSSSLWLFDETIKTLEEMKQKKKDEILKIDWVLTLLNNLK